MKQILIPQLTHWFLHCTDAPCYNFFYPKTYSSNSSSPISSLPPIQTLVDLHFPPIQNYDTRLHCMCIMACLPTEMDYTSPRTTYLMTHASFSFLANHHPLISSTLLLLLLDGACTNPLITQTLMMNQAVSQNTECPAGRMDMEWNHEAMKILKESCWLSKGREHTLHTLHVHTLNQSRHNAQNIAKSVSMFHFTKIAYPSPRKFMAIIMMIEIITGMNQQIIWGYFDFQHSFYAEWIRNFPIDRMQS